MTFKQMTATLSKENKILQEAKNYLPDPNSSKIAVAMSGGVDSSVALYLLKEAGYDVVGITAWIISGGGRCCDDGVIDAVKICDQLGVEHHAVDLRKDFAQGIMKEFHESYQIGETPIPCISCNNDVKWGSLLDYSVEKLGATHLASGHYSKIVENEGIFELFRSIDDNKDQSYMLWGLTQNQLSKTIFPLADSTKKDNREIAAKANLCVAKKPDSQDICFVSNGMTNADYLTKIIGEKPGDIIEISSGKVLGQHKGSFNFTYGQRKGLGISYSEPIYVVKIDPQNNKVYVGTKDKLFSQKAIGRVANIIAKDLGSEFEAMVKVRYNSQPSKAKVYLRTYDEVAADLKDQIVEEAIEKHSGQYVEVLFEEPVEAVTPGQAMAFYDPHIPERVFGGAWIDKLSVTENFYL